MRGRRPTPPDYLENNMFVNDNLRGIFDMLNADYHANSALSASGLKELAKSPAHYRASRIVFREETPAMRLGTAVHCAILEPERFAVEYVGANLDLRTKDGKAARDQYLAAGKTILTSEDYGTVEAMRDAVMSHPTAGALLSQGRAETSVFADLDDVSCKCRPDWLRDDGIIVDLKTTISASPRDFGRTVANFGYHLQQHHYLATCQAAGLNVTRFLFIAVEKTPPFGVSVNLLDDAALEVAANQHDRLLSLYRECRADDRWPCYPDDICITSLPAWAGYYQEDY